MKKTLTRLADLISEETGKNPLVFLDTGAVIHIERRLDIPKSGSLTKKDAYEILDSRFPIYVPEGILLISTPCGCLLRILCLRYSETQTSPDTRYFFEPNTNLSTMAS